MTESDKHINWLNLWERPGFLIRRLNQIHHAIFHHTFTGEITPIQYGLLTVLKQHKDGLDQTSLGEELGTDRTTLAGAIEQLKKKGWVKYQPSRQDKRRKMVVITLKGARHLEKSVEQMIEAQKQFLSPLSISEQRQFIDLMKKLVSENDHHVSVPVRYFQQ